MSDDVPVSADAIDFLESSHWRPVRLLLEAVDADIASVYADAGLAGVRTRFVGPLIRLARRGPMNIGELATATEVTHSAMSQTVAAMRKEGLVESAPDGDDRRMRRVRLSARAQQVLPLLEAEWRATETVLRQLEGETPYPLSRAVADVRAALERQPFRQRLLAAMGASGPGVAPSGIEPTPRTE